MEMEGGEDFLFVQMILKTLDDLKNASLSLKLEIILFMSNPCIMV